MPPSFSTPPPHFARTAYTGYRLPRLGCRTEPTCAAAGGMGNEQSVVKNVDKRTARREQAQYFRPAIQAFKMEATDGKPVEVIRTLSQSALGGMRVCVRKRPIFPHEVKQGEYDVVTCLLRSGTAHVVVHDARMHPDMKKMFINHHAFSFDAVFGEATSNRSVYTETAAPLVGRAVNDSVTATIMMCKCCCPTSACPPAASTYWPVSRSRWPDGQRQDIHYGLYI